MPFPALDDLFSEETRDSVLSALLVGAELVGLKVTAWQPGQPVRSILTLVAQKIADNTLKGREAVKGGLLDYATEDWLTLLALSLYRVTRNPAEYAEGDTIQFTNGSGSIAPFAPGEFIVAHAVTGKTYRNTETLSLAPGVTSDISVIADEVGTDSDAAPGTITTLVSSVAGSTVTNVAAVLGADEETDPDLRQRCREKLGSLSPNGPKEAYAYVAKTPVFPDGTPCAPVGVPITRVDVQLDEDTGQLTIYIATAAGTPDPADVTIVDDAIDRWAAPWGTRFDTVGSPETVIDITYEAWIQGSNLTEVQIENAIATALAQYLKSVAIGGFLIPPDVVGHIYVGALERVIGGATPGIIKVAVTIPAADVPIPIGNVAILGAITPTITVVT